MGEERKLSEIEIRALKKKIDEYEQVIKDAENALDAATEDLEEALAEAFEEKEGVSCSTVRQCGNRVKPEGGMQDGRKQ